MEIEIVGWRFEFVEWSWGMFECCSFDFVGGDLNVGALTLLEEI